MPKEFAVFFHTKWNEVPAPFLYKQQNIGTEKSPVYLTLALLKTPEYNVQEFNRAYAYLKRLFFGDFDFRGHLVRTEEYDNKKIWNLEKIWEDYA